MEYVFDMEADWIGWYRLKNGMLLLCDEYEGSGSWEKEWEGCDLLPDGAVYYTIYDGEDEVDGGVMGYLYGEPFSNFEEFLMSICPDYEIVERAKEPDWFI